MVATAVVGSRVMRVIGGRDPFIEMHKWLWFEEDSITEEESRTVAEELGIDIEAWAREIEERL